MNVHRYARLHADPLSGSQPTRLTHEGRIQYISADYMADAMLQHAQSSIRKMLLLERAGCPDLKHGYMGYQYVHGQHDG